MTTFYNVIITKYTNGLPETKIIGPYDQSVMQLYERKLLIVSNHPSRFGAICIMVVEIKMFLIYHMTSRDHVF